MRTNPTPRSRSFNSRLYISLLLALAGTSLAMWSFAGNQSGVKRSPRKGPQSVAPAKETAARLQTKRETAPNTPSPTGATLSTSNRTITYTDSTGAPLNLTGVALGKPNCGPTGALCSTFNLTIDPTVGTAVGGYDPTQYQIKCSWSWQVSTVDYDFWIEDATGTTTVAQNNSTADPSVIVLPTTLAPATYQIVVVLATGAPIPYTGSITLEQKPAVTGLCGPPAACTPPRYISYSAGAGQAASRHPHRRARHVGRPGGAGL